MSTKRKNTPSGYGYESDFPTRLRELMENRSEISPLKRKVTQAELAKHLGVTRQAISAYTLGTSIPDIVKFKAIADFFKVSYAYLLGRTNIINEDYNSFAERTKLPPHTLSNILNICRYDIDAEAFSLLVDAPSFTTLLIALRSYLSIPNSGSCTPDMLVFIDSKVQAATNGAIKAVPAKLEKDIILMNAQRYLSDIFRYVDTIEEDRIKKEIEKENQQTKK